MLCSWVSHGPVVSWAMIAFMLAVTPTGIVAYCRLAMVACEACI